MVTARDGGPGRLGWSLACGGLFACGGAGDTTQVRGNLERLSVVTFNTALGVGLAEHPAERLEAIARDLPALDADVICLQEVWQHADVERLVALLEPVYPYAHWSVQPAQSGSAGAACLSSESEILVSCLEGSCSGLAGQPLALCAISNCADDFTRVSTACQECVIANQDVPPMAIARICSDDAAEVAAFEEQNGLLLLSRLELEDLAFRAMSSSLGDRGLLAARLASDLVAPVDVLCTHLTPTFSDISYAGEFGSWEGERHHHVSELLRFAAERRDRGSSVLLGDMNCGPETALARGAGPATFARFAAAGYRAPYVESATPTCTFCTNNPLVGAPRGGDELGVILDHVLVRSLPEGVDTSARRVLDAGVVVEVAGQSVSTAHSDHYGVRATFGL